MTSFRSDRTIQREAQILSQTSADTSDRLRARLDELIEQNHQIHDLDCINLNPASNVASPRAEAALTRRLGTRASLGHAGEKYEMGLEAVEQLEVLTVDLAKRVFGADHAEIRVGSGALANLYAFMATCRPGDTIIVPPPSIGGHVTHHAAGAAGLYGLEIVEAPIDADRYSVDPVALAELAAAKQPTLITLGTSLNLLPHPVAQVRAVADDVGAILLFDAAHACGMFAGRAWPSPLDEGAHLMTMSTYKSLAGPAGGLVLTNDDDLAATIDAIAFPGLTANFDAGRTTALAFTLLDWIEFGQQYCAEMIGSARSLAEQLTERGVDVFTTTEGPTRSHQFALRAPDGGHAMAERLRVANLLTCAIGLPDGDGLRIGTPEAVRWGMTSADMATVAGFIDDALTDDPANVAPAVSDFRRRFTEVHFCAKN